MSAIRSKFKQLGTYTINSIKDNIKYIVKNTPLFYVMYQNIFGNYRHKTTSELNLLRKKRGIQKKYGFPRDIAFEPVSMCILDCDFCIIKKIKTYKYRRNVSMKFEEFKKIIDDISFFTTDLQFSGGEPLLNKDIFKMLSYARECNINTLLATNALLLSRGNNLQELMDSPPDKILISYEALDKETYESIRKKGDFEKLTQNIVDLIKLKRSKKQTYPVIALQMVLTKKNIKYEKDYFQQVKNMGADEASIKALGVWPEGDPEYDREMVENYIITKSQHPVSRHEIDENGNIVFFRKQGQCPATKHALIGSGGEVIPCWYIVAKTEVMGNAIDDNFIDIWNSQKYTEYRHKMLNDWANPLCKRCIGVGATAVKSLII